MINREKSQVRAQALGRLQVISLAISRVISPETRRVSLEGMKPDSEQARAQARAQVKWPVKWLVKRLVNALTKEDGFYVPEFHPHPSWVKVPPTHLRRPRPVRLPGLSEGSGRSYAPQSAAGAPRKPAAACAARLTPPQR